MTSTSSGLKGSVRYSPDSGDFAEEGKYYEQKVTAFISLEALNNTDDFCLISNPPKCAPFDDIILCTTTNKKNIIYLFQVKSKLNPTAIIDDEFKFESFCKDNKKIKSKLHIETLYKRYPKAKEEIARFIPEKYAESIEKIVIFTNRPIEENTQILELLDTNMFTASQGKIYKFNSGYIKGITANDTKKQLFLQSILVHAVQSDIDIANTSIDRIKDHFNSGRDIAEAIKFEYFNCVKNWCEIKSEKESLTKEFIYKLFTYSTLKNFAVPLEDYDERAYKKSQEIFAEDCFGLLWDSIKSKNLRLRPEYKNYVLGKALEDFQRLNIVAEEYEQIICSDELKRTDKKRQLEYYIGFLLGELPLIVQDFNLTLNGEFLKIVAITPEAQRNWLEINENIRDEIKQVRVTTRSNQTFKVEDIIGGLSNEASISDVLNLIFYSRNQQNDDKEILITRRINRIFLNKTIFSDGNNTNELFIINTNLKINEFIAWSGVNEENILAFPDYIEIVRYLEQENFTKYKYILINEQKLPEIANVKKSRYANIHFLKCFNIRRTRGDNEIEVEWIKCNGSVEGIKKFRCSTPCNKIQREINNADKYIPNNCLCCMKLKEIGINIQNPFIIIAGVPGAGKTKLLKQFAQIALTNNFILFIALTDHYVYYDNYKNVTAEEHLKYFYKQECTLFDDFFANKISTKNIIILFDAFDEIAPKYTNTVSEIVKKIRECNYNIIMTTRSVLKDKVEDIFETFAFSLNLFYKQDQKKYLKAYHKLNISTLSNDTFFKIVLDNMPNDIEFCKVPVNLHLIADVIYNDIKHNGLKNEDEYKLDNLKLYERFINYRMGVYSQKIKNTNISESNILSYHKYCSIKLLFNKLRVYEIIGPFLDIKLDDYFNNFKEGNDKVGILIDDVNEIIIIHRTVAEFLAAQWLIEVFTISTKKSSFSQVSQKFAERLIKMIMFPQKCISKDSNGDYNEDYDEANFPVVRSFINLMINKNQLHKAAWEGDYKLLNQIVINSDIQTLNTLNDFNRTILYTIISNNTSIYESESLEVRQDIIKVVKFLLTNCKFMLTQKDSFRLSVQDYAKQNKVNSPLLKIVIHKIDGECYVYFNRDFKLWEIFRPENLCNCNIYELLDALQVVENNYLSTIIKAALEGNVDVISPFYNSRITCVTEYEHKRSPPYMFNKKDTSITHYSVIGGNLELICYLNENKLNFKSYDAIGFSAFHYAIIFDKINIVKYFVTKGFDINFCTNKHDFIPLQLAAAFCNIEIFEFLLEKGADINCKTKDENTLLHLCTWLNSYIKQETSIMLFPKYDKKCFDCVTLLLKKGLDINAKTEYATPLINAVYNNNETLTRFLIENSADINFRNEYGCTALHAAAQNCNIEILKLLFEHNADIGAVDRNKNSVLHYALMGPYKNHYHTVRFLTEQGANPNAANLDGITPLHVATFEQWTAELKFFIQITNFNVNINAQDNEGNTALHYATYRHSSTDIVKYLIENHADVNLSNKKNQTPLDVAIVRNSMEMKLILKRKNGISKDSSHKSGPRNIEDVVYRFEAEHKDMKKFIQFYLQYDW